MSNDATSVNTTLATCNLHMAHDHHTVIQDLSLTLNPGKVTAIVGPNGCGKSTLLHGLARVHRPAGGSVLLDGGDIHRQPSREIARRLALLPQDKESPEGLTVRDLVGFGRHPHQDWFRPPGPQDRAAVENALGAARLADLAHRTLDTLSGGQRQRAWIAMSMAQQTPLLLLDEPTTALDLGHQIEVFELIRQLAATGRTIAMVIHDLPSACRYADHLVAMQKGAIMSAGPPGEVVTKALVRDLYGVECDLLEDPATGSPLLINMRRSTHP